MAFRVIDRGGVRRGRLEHAAGYPGSFRFRCQRKKLVPIVALLSKLSFFVLLTPPVRLLCRGAGPTQPLVTSWENL